MPPSISVVIPAYNAWQHLTECLESVFRQEVASAFEIIVVDDGSTDGTRDCLSAFPSVVYLAQTNRGPAAARNAGIARSRGTFIAFLDADDLWPAGKLQKQIGMLQQHPDAAMCFGDCRQFEDKDPWPQTLFEENRQDVSLWGAGPYLPEAYARLLTANFITTGSVVVRRQVLEALGGFDASLRRVEDLELWLRLARRHPILWCKDVCLLRRRHADNASGDAEAMSLAYLEVLKRQQVCGAADLARQGIALSALIAREYREMAERALAGRHSGRAMRWAWHSFTSQPNLRALGCLALGAGQKLRFGNTQT